MTDRAAADAIRAAADAIQARLGAPLPTIALALGSGMSGLRLEESRSVPYSDLPGWPGVGVSGHAGELTRGTLGGVPLLALRGRAHMYEGLPPADVVRPVRALHEAGVRTLVLTNAAGSLDPLLPPGCLMLIADHVNLMARSPLAGPVASKEQRFPDLLDCYDPDLRLVLRDAALDVGIALRQGVYAAVVGPSYETPAEIRMLRRLGARAVGMSTVPEAITARALGMRVAGLSCITNFASGVGSGPLAHSDVVEMGGNLVPTLAKLLRSALPRMAPSPTVEPS